MNALNQFVSIIEKVDAPATPPPQEAAATPRTPLDGVEGSPLEHRIDVDPDGGKVEGHGESSEGDATAGAGGAGLLLPPPNPRSNSAVPNDAGATPVSAPQRSRSLGIPDAETPQGRVAGFITTLGKSVGIEAAGSEPSDDGAEAETAPEVLLDRELPCLDGMDAADLRRLVLATHAQEKHAVALYRSKLADLHNVMEDYTAFRKLALKQMGDCRAAAASGDAAEVSALLATVDSHVLDREERTTAEVQSWYTTLRREALSEAAGARGLEALTQHLQATVQDLEGQLQEAIAAAAAAATAAPPARLALPLPATREAGSEAERPSLPPLEAAAAAEAEAVAVAAAAAATAEDELQRLRKKVGKCTAEAGAKQATISALYGEKEELRLRLDDALTRLEHANTLPQGQVDESKFFKTLSHRGRWGEQVVTAATRLDYYALFVGRILYSHASIRVFIALYLVFMHLWVFFVVSSYVHLLPHTQSIHEHQQLFENGGPGGSNSN